MTYMISGSTVPLILSTKPYLHNAHDSGVFTTPVCSRWVWLGVGVLIFGIVLFNVVCVLAHKLLPPYGIQTAVMSEESLRERELTKKGNFAKAGEVAVDVPKQVSDFLYTLCVADHLDLSLLTRATFPRREKLMLACQNRLVNFYTPVHGQSSRLNADI